MEVPADTQTVRKAAGRRSISPACLGVHAACVVVPRVAGRREAAPSRALSLNCAALLRRLAADPSCPAPPQDPAPACSSAYLSQTLGPQVRCRYMQRGHGAGVDRRGDRGAAIAALASPTRP